MTTVVRTQTSKNTDSGHRKNGPETRVPEIRVCQNVAGIVLVRELCASLDKRGVAYCHWKSNAALDRSASGDNDLDLLVRRSDAAQFYEVLFRLGFRQAQAPADKEMPGIQDFYGYDIEADKFVHVHAHFQLIIGHDMTKNYCLPLVEPFLDSSLQSDLFRVPAPEFEFIVFVIRMMLKHVTWDAVLFGRGSLTSSEQLELTYLQSRVDEDLVTHERVTRAYVGLYAHACSQAMCMTVIRHVLEPCPQRWGVSHDRAEGAENAAPTLA